LVTPNAKGTPRSGRAISTTRSRLPDADGRPRTIPSSPGPATLTAVNAVHASAVAHTAPGREATPSTPRPAATASPNRRAQRARAASMPVRETTVDTHIETAISTTETPE